MESTVEIEPSEARSEGVGEKRPLEEDVDVDVLNEKEDESPLKRIKGGNGRRSLVGGDVKKVAEMVLVLAAMGKMRGGKGPTDAEKDLMVEARNRLAKVCEGFAPKDVFPRDAFGGVLEDLGLNRLKDQRLGFRPPKLSIAEKLLISKRKMEKVENFSLPSTPQSSQRLQGNHGAAVELRNAHHVQMSQLAKSNHMSIASGNFQSASPLGHVAGSKSIPPTYQLPTSEVRPTVSGASPSSHLGSAVLPRVDRPHLRSDGRTNGPVHPSQVQANYSANSTVRTPTWSVQPQSASSVKIGSDNKVPHSMSLKVEGSADVRSGLPTQAMSRTVNAQTSGPLAQGTKYVQAPSLGSNHIEIGKIVQKLLHPHVTEVPTWNPPSRDYMSKALTCQVCMFTATDIDSVIICDACEKGYHLKCLQTTNQKGVPKGEWHCGKCLALSNGKPIPPKYGRVMRNNITPKPSSSTAAVVSASGKNIGALDDNVGQPKITLNGDSSMQNVPTGVPDNKSNHHAPGSVSEDAKGTQEFDNFSNIVPSNLMEISQSACISPSNSSLEKTSDIIAVELKPNSSAKLETKTNLSDKAQAIVSAQDENHIVQDENQIAPDENLMLVNDEPSPLKPSLESHIAVRDLEESHGDQTSENANLQKEHEVVHNNTSEVAAKTGIMTSSDALHAVEWVGDPIQVLDDKTYYASCRIKGHLYKTMDHVLIRFANDKLVPSKLQTMWEDRNSTMKWVTVNRCYFPGELPEAVGRPCSLEGSEVYESTFGKTMMIGLIESPCEVLPPRKFAEESERRTRTGMQLNDRLSPLYLCKWIYDEAKGLFRDISC